MIIVAILRVKNEARWIERCLRSLHFCDKVIVLDDHSTDATPGIVVKLGAELIRSPFEGLDEPRDRNLLLERAAEFAPDWIVCPDGDEKFTAEATASLLEWVGRAVQSAPLEFITLSFPILYLWNDEQTVRRDGVYREFRAVRAFEFRPSLRYPKGQGLPGFHCGTPESSLRMMRRKGFAPQGPLLHFGYIDAAERRRKFEFYRANDPGNQLEDNYRHLTQGDPGGEGAEVRLRHAGPLQLKSLDEVLCLTPSR